jgi:hypothetical protein
VPALAEMIVSGRQQLAYGVFGIRNDIFFKKNDLTGTPALCCKKHRARFGNGWQFFHEFTKWGAVRVRADASKLLQVVDNQ